MSETRTAKLFKNGASQAVRLPAEFRFEGTEVYATRDEATGIWSSLPVLEPRCGRTSSTSCARWTCLLTS